MNGRDARSPEREMLTVGGKFGDFDVVRELGVGGMGAVYLVRDPETGGEYAAKLMLPGLGGADRTSRGRLAIRTGGGWLVGEDASSGTLFVKSPAMMATSFVESPLMESGGLFVDDGGLEPP